MGMFQWCRVPMELKGAPAYFQRMMETIVLAGFLWVFVAVYLDDLIVFASSFSDKVEYMQVELAPLRRMGEEFRRTKRIVWTDDGISQFEKIKDMINNHQKIFFYQEVHGDVFLFTDASDYGIGAYLCQYDRETNREYPVGYLSEALSSTKRRWTTIEKECYAIVKAFEKFEHLLRDVQFVLFTDHANLTYLNVPRSSKVLRWKLSIQEYDFAISHLEGVRNVVADTFLRMLNDGAIDKPDGEDVPTLAGLSMGAHR